MKEDVIKFRKIYKILIDNKVLHKNSIIKELGLSEPSLHKILTADLDDLKGLRASTLGLLQDFMKRHIGHVNYAGIEAETVKDAVPELTPDVRMKRNQDVLVKLKPGAKERREQELKEKAENTISVYSLDPSHGKAKDFNDNKEMRSKTKLKAHFWNFIQEATNCVPENVIITITINERKL